MNPKLIVTKNENIITITLNRPEVHNAFDQELINLFLHTLAEINGDNTICAVLLKANGKTFCAGADLNWMQETIHYSKEQNYHDAMQLAELMHRLNSVNKPVIALVDGAVYGGGMGLIACSDIVLATDRASFCLSEVKIGLIPATISPYLIAVIGERQARRYFLTAEKISVHKALELGLIHEKVVNLEETAMNFVNLLGANSPAAITSTKNLIQHLANKHISSGLIQETAEMLAEIRASKDAQERMKAFLGK